MAQELTICLDKFKQAMQSVVRRHKLWFVLWPMYHLSAEFCENRLSGFFWRNLAKK